MSSPIYHRRCVWVLLCLASLPGVAGRRPRPHPRNRRRKSSARRAREDDAQRKGWPQKRKQKERPPALSLALSLSTPVFFSSARSRSFPPPRQVAGYLRTVAAAKAAKGRALEVAAGGSSFLSSLCPPCATGSNSVAAPPPSLAPQPLLPDKGKQTEMTRGV